MKTGVVLLATGSTIALFGAYDMRTAADPVNARSLFLVAFGMWLALIGSLATLMNLSARLTFTRDRTPGRYANMEVEEVQSSCAVCGLDIYLNDNGKWYHYEHGKDQLHQAVKAAEPEPKSRQRSKKGLSGRLSAQRVHPRR